MMVSHDEHSRIIEIRLPNENREKIVLQNHATVADLKIVCECCLGIPAELVKIFEENGKTNEELTNTEIIFTNAIRLQVPIWWNKCVCSVLNKDIQSTYRRVQLPMQQVGRDERVFVAMFMGCSRGMHDLISLLVTLETTIDLCTTTDSGRTLLHACAMGGSLKCLEIVVKHLLKGNYESFGTLDKTKQTALQLAQKLGHTGITERLSEYIKENKKTVNLDFITNSPNQKQANRHRKINSGPMVNERFVHEDKHNHASSDCTNTAANEPVVEVDVIPTNSDIIVQPSIIDDQSAGVLPEHISFTRKPFLRRPKEQNSNLIKIQVHDQDSVKNITSLPSLVTNYDVKTATSLPCSPVRTSPVNDVIEYCNSAPNSPKFGRRPFRAAGLATRFAIAPSPPRNQFMSSGDKKDFRRGSLAMGASIYRNPDRKKSRSICEVTLRESLGAFHKTMDAGEERIELPWNAWIAARRQDNLPPTQERQLNAPQSPSGNRRRSFVQWLNDKDLDVLRKQHAESQLDAVLEEEQLSGKRGKSFEEWLEEKHTESKKGKDKEKEKEEAQKNEEENKMRRRRMSHQKYQSWLQAKELSALEAEEKLLGEAKHKLEKMKIQWEEEDELRKTNYQKVSVSRTRSCPTRKNNSKISRERFSSLNNK
ncbi:uncharacterized protein LOC110251162 [Exaiptasia diaphana]|uniref:Uncharacterized protein n=1 Tax=Exaiptasia diaphana TaxID=2652724 RepID=A0A913Y2J3_EXADI|nr:uncharacterized protein LOC110251162 [Exaiptasia diaphana]KXJ23138.1 hypothetical protein AC249_AIPGENE10516 [Exaiptasia diaphana]